MKFELPYGKESMTLEVADEHLAGVLRSGISEYRAEKDAQALVDEAMAKPIGSPRLWELAKDKRKVTLIVSDHTRPVPSKYIVPRMLAEIRKGNPEAEITLLVATGLHRTTTVEELKAKLGEEIVANEKIVVHDCDDATNLVNLGKLPSGGELIINRLAAEADLLVAEGFIEPHFFAGFSGGRKSVLPGVAARATVMWNHNSAFIDHPLARTGSIMGNPIHEDMLFAAKAAKLAYVVNVVIDSKHEPIYAVAGDCDAAHIEGRKFLASKCQVAPVEADIAVTTNGGYPLDQNIYQAVKGMTAAESTVKKGGVIVMFAKSSDGHGGASFHRTFKEEPDLEKMMAGFLARRPGETIVDQWQSQIFARVMLKARVVYVSACDDELVKDMHMIPAHSAEEAMAKAAQLVGRADYQVTVIPDGVSVIVK